MNNMKFILKKLKKDIIKELYEEYHDDLSCGEEKFKGIIDSSVNNYFHKNDITFETELKEKGSNYRDRELYTYDETNCIARIWNDGHGNGGQCSRKHHTGDKFCKKHQKLFDEGNLWLGIITDPRPENPVYYKSGKVKKWKS